MLSSPWLLWASWGASCSPHVGRQLCGVCEHRHSWEWWTRNRWRTCPSASRRYYGWHVILRLSEASRHFCLIWLWAPKAMPSRPQITHIKKKNKPPRNSDKFLALRNPAFSEMSSQEKASRIYSSIYGSFCASSSTKTTSLQKHTMPVHTPVHAHKERWKYSLYEHTSVWLLQKNC